MLLTTSGDWRCNRSAVNKGSGVGLIRDLEAITLSGNVRVSTAFRVVQALV